jgi:hypothetical protein
MMNAPIHKHRLKFEPNEGTPGDTFGMTFRCSKCNQAVTYRRIEIEFLLLGYIIPRNFDTRIQWMGEALFGIAPMERSTLRARAEERSRENKRRRDLLKKNFGEPGGLFES